MRKNYRIFAVIGAFLCAAAGVVRAEYTVGNLKYDILNENQVMVLEPVEALTGEVVIPSSVEINGKSYMVTAIDDYCFRNNSGITAVTLPATIDSIGVQAFNGCSAMKSINLGDTKLRNLQVSTFLYCRALEAIVIPNTVTKIGINPFMETNSLKAITLAPGNPNYAADKGMLYTKNFKRLISCPGGLLNAEISTLTDTIESSAFCQNRRVRTVNIPEGVTYIANNAFMRCDSLQEIKIPSTVKYIGGSAFAECKQAAGTIVIPEGCRASTKAFYWTGITSIEFPASMTSIPDQAVMNCVKLTSVTLKEGTVSIGQNAFNTCAISEIVLPNSVTTLKASVFEGSTRLKTITFGSGFLTAGIRCFNKLNNITNIYLNTTTPPTVSSTSSYPAFTATVYGKCTLHVPEGTLATYKEAEPWKNFTTIQSAGVDGVIDNELTVSKNAEGIVVMGADNQEIRVYNLNGSLVYQGTEGIIALPQGGVYLVRVGSKVLKIAI